MALRYTPPLSPTDASVNHGIDFSDVLAPGVTLASVVGVDSLGDIVTVAGGSVGDGKRASCVAQFKLTSVAPGSAIVTASIIDSAGESLARSILVPVVATP
jgi:hypothetical protein